MRAKDIELSDLVSISDGDINLRGRRLVIHSIHAFSQFRFDLIKTLGKDHARQLITRFGYFWGQADAAALQRIYNWPSVEEWIKAGIRLSTLEGIAKSKILSCSLNKEEATLTMEVSWHNSVEVEEHLMNFEPGDQTVCWKLTGYLSGFTSYCLGQSIYFVESHCQAKRDGFCSATGKDVITWGDMITPYLKYYEAEDIKGIVKQLTLELTEKTLALKKHKKELKKYKFPSVPYLVEGSSKSMRDILSLASKAAKYDSSILITGETGTGKEVIARYIHDTSNRSKEPFIVINCVALPESLIDSELFGYKSGSFTGASQNRVGLFEEATNGTVFLDEIGDISLSTQLKILRVLQEKEILRIGENIPRKSNVRIIAATNKGLNLAVASKEFREDLLYRLRVVELNLPGLRDRREDIIPLSKYLIGRIAAKLNIEKLHLDAECAELLEAYDWPGNVRELENTLERAAVVSSDGLIQPKHLPEKIYVENTKSLERDEFSRLSLKQLEREHILRILQYTGGSKRKSAHLLGISESTLWRKLKEIEESI